MRTLGMAIVLIFGGIVFLTIAVLWVVVAAQAVMASSSNPSALVVAILMISIPLVGIGVLIADANR